MISIIVPVYNGERYIERCIESLINNEAEIEVIIVNDGSTDATAKKLERYENNKRIKIINQKNQGVSVARNKGIEMAAGMYIMFCDCDDCYDENVINKISQRTKSEIFDLLVFGRKDIQNNRVISVYNIKKMKDKDISNIEYLEDFFCAGTHTYSVVNKVYKTDNIKKMGIKFTEGIKYSEDTLFNLEYILHCNKVIINEDCYYLRYCNEGSAIYKKCEDFYWKNIKIIDEFFKKIEDTEKLEKYKKAIEELYKHYAIVSIYRICDGIDEENLKKDNEQIKKIIEDIQSRKIKLTNGKSYRDKLLYYLINKNKSFLIYIIFNKLRKIYHYIRKEKNTNED